MNRLNELSARIESHLHEFGAIDLREEPKPWSCDSRPSYPRLYISERKDKTLMDLPSSGQALVGYRVRRRHVDETQEDGPRYGTDIDILSLEPVDDEPAETGLESTIFLREFAGDRNRDEAGRFVAGSAPSPDDFALARRKKKAVAAGAAGVAAAGALAGTKPGRTAVARVGSGLARTAAGLIRR